MMLLFMVLSWLGMFPSRVFVDVIRADLISV
jgi:hypothetical protein